MSASDYITFGGQTVSIVNANYVDDNGEPLGNLQSADLVAQSAAIGASYASTLGPFGAAAAAAASGAALGISLSLLGQAVSAASNNPNVISNDVTAVGQLLEVLGDVTLAISDAAKVAPALEPLGELAEAYGNFFTLAGMALANPVYVGEVLNTGWNTLIMSVEAEASNFASALSADVSPLGSTWNAIANDVSGLTLNFANEAAAIGSSSITDYLLNGSTEATDSNQDLDTLFGSLGAQSQTISETQSTLNDEVIVSTPDDSMALSDGTMYFNSNGSVEELFNESDGGSELDQLGLDGSYVVTNYSEADGTGYVTQIEDDNPGGTSSITYMGPGGASTTETYNGPHGSGTPGQTTCRFQYTSLYENQLINYSAGVSFDNVIFTLPSVRVGDALNTTFGTTAYFAAGNLNPDTENIVDLDINDEDGAEPLFVSPNHTAATITCTTAGWALDTPGVFEDISLGDSASYDGAAGGNLALAYNIKVYATAVADITYPNSAVSPTFYFHVGDAASVQIIVSNTATGALTDALGIGVGSSPGIVDGVSPLADLTQNQSATVTVGLNTSLSGAYVVDGDDFSFLSHDPDLPDVAAQWSGHGFNVNIDQFADPILADVSTGPEAGDFESAGANAWTLNFGYVVAVTNLNQGEALIDINNGASAAAEMDNLAGSVSATGGGFYDSYALALNGGSLPLASSISPGGSLALGQFSPLASVLGEQSEVVTFSPLDFNASGYSGALPNQTLTITGDVVPASEVPIAMFLADETVLDEVSGGFSIVDAAANVAPNLAALQADTNLNSITISGGALLSLSAQQVADYAQVLAKLVGPAQCAIADSAADIDAQEAAVTSFIASGHVELVETDGAALTVSGGVSLLISGGANAVSFGGTSGNTIELDDSNGNWDSVQGSNDTVELNGAQASVTGGGNQIDLSDNEANATSLYATDGAWDAVNGSGGALILNAAQASVLGGDDILYMNGASSVSLYQTDGAWDAVYGSGQSITLNSAEASVVGGGDLLYLNGASSVSLSATDNNWDALYGSGDTDILNSAQAGVVGGGNTLYLNGACKVSIAATDGAWDAIHGSDQSVVLTNAQAGVVGGGNTLYLNGACKVSIAATDGAWDAIYGSNQSAVLTNAQAGVVGGGNTLYLNGASSVSLAGTNNDWDAVYGSGQTEILDSAQATIVGDGDQIYLGGANTFTLSGTSDALATGQALGQDWILGFGSTDTMQFSAADFANFHALQNAMTQSGSNTLITLDATNDVTLYNVQASSLQASQFSFV